MQIFLAIKKNGKFSIEKDFKDYVDKLKDGLYKIEFEKKVRSTRQNRALHLYFALLAQELNDAGFDMKKTLREDVDIPWKPETIKENLWRPLQKSYLGIDSTKDLKSGDIDQIYEIINKVIGERTGVYVPFPSIDSDLENIKF